MTGRGTPPKLAQAAALHQAGRLDEAERGYRRILREHRKDADTHYLLGVLRLQKGDAGQGVVLLRRALAVSPAMPHGLEGLAGAEEEAGRPAAALALARHAGAAAPAPLPGLTARQARLLFGLGRYAEAERLFAEMARAGQAARPARLDRSLCLRRLGRTDEAEAVYAELLREVPGDPDALLGLGEARAEGGRPRDGMAPLRSLVALVPAHLPARLRHAVLRQDTGASAEALREAGSVVAVLPAGTEADPLRVSALSLMAAALRALGRPSEAQGRLRRLLALAPGLADGWSNAANLASRADPAAAELMAGRALAADAAHVGALVNRALALAELERFGAALRSLRRALVLTPADKSALANLSHFVGTLMELQEWSALDRLLLRVLAIDPTLVMARYMIGTAALARGDLRRGWANWEARFDSPDIQMPRPFPQPGWDGQPLTGRLLVWGEQGLGDELKFGSMLPDLAAQGITAAVEVDQRLVSIYARAFPTFEIVARTTPPDPRLLAGDISHQIAMGSLARIFRTTHASFGQRSGFLAPDPGRFLEAKRWLDGLGPEPKIGIAWRSGNRDAAARRVHTDLAQWGPILSARRAHFVNLQYGDCREELEEARSRFAPRLHEQPGLDLFHDIEGVLALSAGLDLIVSTNTTAFVPGAACGVELWMLSSPNHHHALGQDRDPWFPNSRRFVRPRGMAWDATICTLAAALERWLIERSGPRHSSSGA